MAASTDSREASAASSRPTDTHRPDSRLTDARGTTEPPSANNTTYDGCDAAVPNATVPFLTNVENHWGRVTLTAPDNMRRRRGREKRIAAQSRPPRLLVSQPGRGSTSDLRRLAQEARLSTRATQALENSALPRSRRNSSNANSSQSAGTRTVLLQSSRGTPAPQTQSSAPVNSSSSSLRCTDASREEQRPPRSWDRRRNVWDEVPETLQLAEMDWVDPPPSFAHAFTDSPPAPSLGPSRPSAPPLATSEQTSMLYREPQSPPPPFVSDDEEAGHNPVHTVMNQTGASSSLRISSSSSSMRNSDTESLDDQSTSDSPVDFRNLQQQMAWESDRLAGYTLEERVRRMQQRLLNASDAWTYRTNSASHSERHHVPRSEQGQDSVAPPIRAPERLPQLAPGRPRLRTHRLSENRAANSHIESMQSEESSTQQPSSASSSLAPRQLIPERVPPTSRFPQLTYTPRSPSSILHQVRAPARIAKAGSQSDHGSDSSQPDTHDDTPSSDSEQEWEREHTALQALHQYERDMRKAVRRSRKQSFNTQQAPMPSEMHHAQSQLLHAFSVLDREMPRAPPSQLSANDAQRDSDNLYDLSSDSDSLWANSSEEQSRDSQRFETLDDEPTSPSSSVPREEEQLDNGSSARRNHSTDPFSSKSEQLNKIASSSREHLDNVPFSKTKQLNDAPSSAREHSGNAVSPREETLSDASRGEQLHKASSSRELLSNASARAGDLAAPINLQKATQTNTFPSSDQTSGKDQSVETPPSKFNPFRDTSEIQSISHENHRHAQAIATHAFAHRSEQTNTAERRKNSKNMEQIKQIPLHNPGVSIRSSSSSPSNTERNSSSVDAPQPDSLNDVSMISNQREGSRNSHGRSVLPTTLSAQLAASSSPSASTQQQATARPLPPLPAASLPRHDKASTPSRAPLMPESRVPASPSTYQRESLARSNSTFTNWRSSTAPKPARSHLPKITPATRHFQPTKDYVHDDTSSSTTSRSGQFGGDELSTASPTASQSNQHAREMRAISAEEPQRSAPPLPLRQNTSSSNAEHDSLVDRRRPAPPPPALPAPAEQRKTSSRTQRTEAAPAIQGSVGALAYTAPTIRAVPLTGSRSSDSQGDTVRRPLRTPMDLVTPSRIRHGEDWYTEPSSTGAMAESGSVPGTTAQTSNRSNADIPRNSAENSASDSTTNETSNGADQQDSLAGMTDLDLVLLSLEDPTLQYEGATLLGDYLGPAPSTALSVDEIQTIPVGIVESDPHGVGMNLDPKNCLSVVGVRVDECAICLQAFKKGELACILPCVHMYVRKLLTN